MADEQRDETTTEDVDEELRDDLDDEEQPSADVDDEDDEDLDDDAADDDDEDADVADDDEDADPGDGDAAEADEVPVDDEADEDDEEEVDEVAEPPKKLKPRELVTGAVRQLQELMGRRPESVSGMERHDDGWRITIEICEMSRIPPTTDVLGTYEVDLTEDGELAGYRRTRRYYRNQAEGSQ